MASKSAYQSQEKGAEIEEALDELEKLLERVRVMYEQYFLGIARMAPSHLHNDCERKIRDVTQIQIRNTALRYRFATLSQKFGAYNSYWKRTLRMIEQGKYVRDLQRIKRKSDRSGEEIPEEILAAMPKLMREKVIRDREMAVQIAERQGKLDAVRDDGAADPRPAGSRPQPGNIHRLDDALVPDDVNVDDLFASLTREAEAAIDAAPRVASRRPARDSVGPPIISAPPRRDDFDPPTERSAPPPEAMAEPPRRTTMPTTPPLRGTTPMRGTTPPPLGRAPTTPPLSSPTLGARPTTPPPMVPVRPTTPPPMAPARPTTPPPMAPVRPTTPPPMAGIRPTTPPPMAGVRPTTPPPMAGVRPTTPPPMQSGPVPRPVPAAPSRPVPSASARSAPGARPGAPESRSSLGPPPGMSDADTRNLYNRYLKARELVGENNDGVTYDKLVRTLRSQSSKIMADHKASGVEFGVVIKDNKVVLKAKPKI